MAKLPLFLALDVADRKQALDIVEKSYPYVLGYKIGPRLFLRYGRDLIVAIKSYDESAKIFLDFKFYDIPSSTVEAVKSCYDIGADFVTVHGGIGEATLKELAQVEKKANSTKPFTVLVVTVLSSVDMQEVDVKSKADQITQTVVQSGLKGVVCSPWELAFLRQKYKGLYLVTPGIRLEGDKKGDQQRVMTPQEAFKEGSSALVMGRSLIHSQDLVQTLKQLQSVY